MELSQHLSLTLVLVVAASAPTPGGQPHTAMSPAGGLPVWASRYHGPGNGADLARTIAASPDGTKVFVTGDSGSDFATVAYAAGGGKRLWASRYDGPAHGFDQALSIAVSPGGHIVFVTGLSTGSGTGYDYATVAYDADTGGQLWAMRYDGPDSMTDEAFSVAVSPGGSAVFVTGWSQGASTDWDFATVAYAATSGRMLWVERYDGPNNAIDQAWSVVVSPGGSTVFVTGFSEQSAVCDCFATVAYDARTGGRRWEARFNANATGAAFVVPSPDGSKVFVAGLGFETVAYDAQTGTQLWQAAYGTGARSAFGIVAAPGGSKVYVTGYSSPDSQDYATVAYDANTGEQAWAATYDGTGHDLDQALSIGASPGGTKVFVTGYSRGPAGGYDYATVAYAAVDGQQLWAARLAGPGNSNDTGRALTVSPGGAKVYVTGWSDWGTGNDDYVTVAYRS
jgi:putative pyrroloquinoline-quinone binding quinoprotein